MGLYAQLVHLGHNSKNIRSSIKRKSLDKKYYKKKKAILREKRGWSILKRYGGNSRSFS